VDASADFDHRAYPHAHGDLHSATYGHAPPDLDAGSHLDAEPDGYPHRNGDLHAHADRHLGHGHADAHGYSNRDADGDTHTDGDANPYGNANTNRDTDGGPDLFLAHAMADEVAGAAHSIGRGKAQRGRMYGGTTTGSARVPGVMVGALLGRADSRVNAKGSAWRARLEVVRLFLGHFVQ